MKALGNNIKVKQEERDTVLPSGIIIPSTVKRKDLVYGEVVEVGEVSIDIEVGHRILYSNARAYKEKVKDGVLFKETGYQLLSVKDVIIWNS